jgi:hypothetical protein
LTLEAIEALENVQKASKAKVWAEDLKLERFMWVTRARLVDTRVQA